MQYAQRLSDLKDCHNGRIALSALKVAETLLQYSVALYR